MAQSMYPTSIGNTVSLNDLVTNSVIGFQKGYAEMEGMYDDPKELYEVRDVGAHNRDTFQVEEHVTVRSPARGVAQGQNFPTIAFAPGYYKTVTSTRKASTSEYTWQLDHHTPYADQIVEWYKDTGWNLRTRLMMDMTHFITFMTATSYTNIDGDSIDVSTGDLNPLAYTAHTLTNSTTTFRTRIAGNPALTSASVEQAMTNFAQQSLGNNGDRLQLMGNAIIVGSSQIVYHRALQIVRSMAPSTAPNSGVYNPLRNALRVLRYFYIDSTAVGAVDTTKSEYWVLADLSNPGGYVYVTEQPNVMVPTLLNGGIQWLNDNRTIRGTACYIVVWLNPRNVQCSTGDGTP